MPPAPRRPPLPRMLLVGILLALCALGGSPAHAAVVDRSAAISARGLADFDQLNTALGTLQPSATHAFRGERSARARITGGGNGYSRGIFNVDWADGEDVWYGAAFYLPPGFRAAQQGQVDLLRWDNWVLDPDTTDRSGVVLWRSDGRAHLVRQRLGVEEVTIAPTFAIPEGRWVVLEVHQRLSSDRGALNEVFLDGRLVARSRSANTYGRPIQRLRAGIVATDAARQRKPLTLWFDRVTIRRGRSANLRSPGR